MKKLFLGTIAIAILFGMIPGTSINSEYPHISSAHAQASSSGGIKPNEIRCKKGCGTVEPYCYC